MAKKLKSLAALSILIVSVFAVVYMPIHVGAQTWFTSVITPNLVAAGKTHTFDVNVTNTESQSSIYKTEITYPNADGWIFVDTSAPTGWFVEEHVAPNVTFKATGGYSIPINGSAIFRIEMTTGTPPSTKSYPWTINCTNTAEEPKWTSLNVTVDNTTPTVDVTAPTTAYYSVGAGNYIWLNLTVTDNVNKLPIVTLNDTRFILHDSPTVTGTYEFEFCYRNNTVIPDGFLAIQINATDYVGNKATPYPEVASTIVDNTYPIITIRVFDDSTGRELPKVSGVYYVGSSTTSLRINYTVTLDGFDTVHAHIMGKEKLTATTNYDRNPSFFEANNGTYWLLFVRSPTGSYIGHTCDSVNDYEVYYMTSTDGGVTWSAETKLAATTTYQRGMAAFQDDTGKIWVFVSGPGPSSNIQYYSSTDGGSTWQGPNATGYNGSHVDALQTSDNSIWVFYEDGGSGIEALKSTDYGATWANVTGIGPAPDDGLPKAMEADGKLYVVWCNWNVGGKAWYTTSTDGLTGTTWDTPNLLVDLPGTIMCDPVLHKDSMGIYWLFYAPWNATTDAQWIESLRSTDGVTWTERTQWTFPANGLWDYWSEIHERNNDLLVFYTSEESQGAISQMTFDTDAYTYVYINNTAIFTGTEVESNNAKNWTYSVVGTDSLVINVTVTDMAKPQSHTSTLKQMVQRDIMGPYLVDFTEVEAVHGGLVIRGLHAEDPSGVYYYQVLVNSTHLIDIHEDKLTSTTLTDEYTFGRAVWLNLTDYAGEFVNITIKAYDLDLNPSDEVIAYTGIIPHGRSYPIELWTGWNLISSPLVLAPYTDVELFLSTMMTGTNYADIVEIMWEYDPTTSPCWYKFIPAFVDEIEYVDDGRGYWIETKTGKHDVLIVQGWSCPAPPNIEPMPPVYPVAELWNMIGYTSIKPGLNAAYLTGVDADYLQILGWEAENQQWVTVFLSSAWFADLEPGHGYWIYMQVEGHIVPPPYP